MTDDKDKTFSEIMRNPNEAEIGEVWLAAQDLAIEFEDKHGYKRDVIIEGLLEAALDLAGKRYDQPTFRHMNDTRRAYLLANEKTKRRLETYANYAVQRSVEKVDGKDQLHSRNARNFGWKPPEDVISEQLERQDKETD